ncbi:MAG TPA: cytochrome c3 family protein [Anaeromyxobacteraceae bacterium]|nr:cytochrome c3 family protein [Anaeromyxobacteraceae bacterium]
MRAIFLAIALSLAPSALAAEGASPAAPAALPADSASCLECHKAGGDGPAVEHLDKFAASVHGQNNVGCTDCHQGYSMGPHDGEAKVSPADAAKVERLAKAVWGEGEKKEKLSSPRALLACQNCHDAEAGAFAKSVHGKWLAGDAKVAGPTCVTCHGSPHAIAKKLEPYVPNATARVAVPADRRELQKVCESCHGNEEYAKAAGLNAEVKASYHDSIHGRMVRVGNKVAPTCVSCHAAADGGTHGILAKTEAASSVSAQNKKATCGRCHEGATDNFAALIAHKPIQEIGGHIVPHVTHIAFSWLTTLTLLFFAFHVLIDFVYELRQRLAAKGHGHSADALKSVVRFDIHQRAQHWFMLSGVILLGVTGWPLRGAGDLEAAGYSRGFLKIFGGAEGAATWHRVGAVLIIISSVYHLFYLTFLAAQKRLPMSMLPVPKDALDMKDNILFMLGLKKERPKFERYMYLEKFDYWAVFWGIVMMVGTGFVFWFPVFFAKFAPAWLITATQIIHGEEATLAITFLFVVHFYNVHLKPSIFPMNWAWINGRISVEALKHEHAAEYERMTDKP